MKVSVIRPDDTTPIDMPFWMAEGDSVTITTTLSIDNGTEARDGVGGASREAGVES
jgi:hypothetical protein